MSDRKEALERTARIRAKIISFLSITDSPYATLGDLRREIPEIDEVGNISSLLGTMVDNGLIKSKEITGDALYSLGYYVDGAEHQGTSTTAPKRPCNRKQSTLLERPEVMVEADRIVIDHPKCRIIVELK